MGNQKSIHLLVLFTIFSLFLASLCWAHLQVEPSTTRHEPEFLQSETLMSQLFQQWKEKHGKMYEHAEEKLKRYENFKHNAKYIVDTNMNRTGFTVSLNRFADMSNEEFKEKYFGKLKKPVHLSEMKESRRRLTCDAPKTLDWREKGAVTQVKAQGTCGSCWAFSSTGAIEAINAINNGELVSLSEQELVDCDTIDEGCDGGDMDNAFKWIVRNGGIDTQADYPYTGVGDSCNARKVANKIVNIDGYEDVERSESSLLCATVNQPISVGIQGSSMDFQLYTGVSN